MPFTGSTFSRLYSWVSDRDANINILASKMDNEMDGFSSAINQIVAGSIPFTGAFKGTGGTVTAPAFSFSNDPNTGMYRVGPDQLGFSVNGSEVLRATINYITTSKQLNVDLNGNVFNGSGDHGIFVKSFSPTLTMIDKNSGAGSAQWQFNEDTLRLIFDTDNDENTGADSNNSDETLLLISTNFFSYKGSTIWHSGNDGAASGLDADLLDGQHGDYYRNADHMNAGTLSNFRINENITFNSVSERTAGNGIKFNNTPKLGTRRIQFGSGASLDDYIEFNETDNTYTFFENGGNRVAKLLSGSCDFNVGVFNTSVTVQGVSVRSASILNSGTISDARLPSSISSDITGNAATATNATNLSGQPQSYYRNASNLNAGTVSLSRLPSTLVEETIYNWTPVLRDGDGDVMGFNSASYKAVKIGNVVHVRFEADMFSNADANANAAYLELPVSAVSIQNLGMAWSNYTNDPDNVIEDIHAADHGGMVARGNRAYFKTVNYDVINGSVPLRHDHLVITFSYLTI